MQIAGYSLVGGELSSGIQISKNPVEVGMSAFSGHPSFVAPHMSAFGGKADMAYCSADVRL